MQTPTLQNTTVDRQDRPETAREMQPVSRELGADLARLEREQQIELDRLRQEELARLRAIQSFD
jgi:hypothetical protein